MNLKNNIRIIEIRTLIDGKIETKSWRYSLSQCKKRDLVHLKITLGKNELGKQYQKSFYGKNETEARKKAKAFLMKEYGFGDNADGEYTISTWIHNYMDLHGRDWSYQGRKTYMDYVRLYIDPMIGHFSLSEFRTSDFQIFYDTLKQRKSQGNQYKNIDSNDVPFLSTLYINKICSFLHSVLENAVDKEVLVRNPVRTNLFDDARFVKNHALSKSDFPYFYDAIKESPYVNYYLFVLATAQRRNEALAIRKCDIDEDAIILRLQFLRLDAGDMPDKNMIVVDKKPSKKNGEMIYYVLVEPKCSSSRFIFITPFIRALLDEQLARLNDPLIKENNKHQFLFTNPEGRYYGESTVGKDLKKRLSDYKLRTGIDLTMYSLHSLRDTNASWLFGANADGLVISKQLGHANVNITNARYRDYIRNEDAENGYLAKKQSLELYIKQTIDSIKKGIENNT